MNLDPRPGPAEATIHEADLCRWLQRFSLNAKEYEAAGGELPDWARGLLGGGLVIVRASDLDRGSKMLVMAGLRAAMGALPPDVRGKLEGPIVGPVPDGVGEDIE